MTIFRIFFFKNIPFFCFFLCFLLKKNPIFQWIKKKIVIALFGKLMGHVIDWFDLKYFYHHYTVAKSEPLFGQKTWFLNMTFKQYYFQKLDICLSPRSGTWFSGTSLAGGGGQGRCPNKHPYTGFPPHLKLYKYDQIWMRGRG